MPIDKIPFTRPYMTGNEVKYISESISTGRLSGDGPFSERCEHWLEKEMGCHRALLTHSCTAALEMAALLLDIEPGDEIIMPSFTFVSTANAFVLRGAIPIFIDIRSDTLNIDERLIEGAITPRTRAILPVHYAGVPCEMDTITSIAKRHQLRVIEDAAQGIMSTYKGHALGTIGDLGAYSFHETKNILSGEGGALLVNDPDLSLRAEIVREKGTDRSRFFRGEVDKYTWQDKGSSFLPGELIAAFLWAQLEQAEWITKMRLSHWDYYHELLAPFEAKGLLNRPSIPEGCSHNAHMYYVLLSPELERQSVLEAFKQANIHATFHYIPLHASPCGERYSRTHGELLHTNRCADQLIRLPLWIGLTEEQQERVADVFKSI